MSARRDVCIAFVTRILVPVSKEAVRDCWVLFQASNQQYDHRLVDEHGTCREECTVQLNSFWKGMSHQTFRTMHMLSAR